MCFFLSIDGNKYIHPFQDYSIHLLYISVIILLFLKCCLFWTSIFHFFNENFEKVVSRVTIALHIWIHIYLKQTNYDNSFYEYTDRIEWKSRKTKPIASNLVLWLYHWNFAVETWTFMVAEPKFWTPSKRYFKDKRHSIPANTVLTFEIISWIFASV